MAIVTANKIKPGMVVNLTGEVHDVDYNEPTILSANFIRVVEQNGWTARVIQTSFRKNNRTKITLRAQNGIEETRTFNDSEQLELLDS